MGLRFNGTEIGSDIKINGNTVQNLKMGTSDVWSGRVKIPSTPIIVKYACMLNNELHIFGRENTTSFSKTINHYYLNNNNWEERVAVTLSSNEDCRRSYFTVLNGYLYFCEKMTVAVKSYMVFHKSDYQVVKSDSAVTTKIYLKKYNHINDSFETITVSMSSKTIASYEELQKRYSPSFYNISYDYGKETDQSNKDIAVCSSSPNSILVFEYTQNSQGTPPDIHVNRYDVNLNSKTAALTGNYLVYRYNTTSANYGVFSCGFCKNFDNTDSFNISRSVFALNMTHYSDASSYIDIGLYDGSTSVINIRDSSVKYNSIYPGLNRTGTGGSSTSFILTRYGDYIYTQSFYRRSATATSITANSYTLWDNKPTIFASEMIVIKNQLVVFGTNKKTASFNGTDWWYST